MKYDWCHWPLFPLGESPLVGLCCALLYHTGWLLHSRTQWLLYVPVACIVHCCIILGGYCTLEPSGYYMYQWPVLCTAV